MIVDPRIGPLHATLRLNTRLLLNCLDGLDDAAGHPRPNERTNSIGFIAAHLVDAGHLLARVIGLEARLARLTVEALDAPAPQRYPIDDRSVLGAIAFLVQHETPITSASWRSCGSTTGRRPCATARVGCPTRCAALS